MNKVIIDFELVTPMFMAGGNQKSAEFRLPSFKGVLRFWYRAVSFSTFQGLKLMKDEEDNIFGSTGNASKIVLNLEAYREGKRGIQFKGKGGLIYLGYGVVDFRGNTTRRYISPSTTGRVSISYRNLNDAQMDRLKKALTAFALFGNLGSRSRKGYGSINFRQITFDGKRIFEQPKTIDDLFIKIQKFTMSNKFIQANSQPPFSAFSSKSRIDILDTGSDAINLLNSIGEQMALYRSWGRNGKVMGKTAERNFRSDHHLIKGMQNGNKPSTHPKRVIFGLPHNYYFVSTNFKVNVEPDSKDINRRASPLFLKIHKVSEKKFAAVSLILQSQFLPKEIKIKMSSKKVTAKVPARPDWKTLIDFIDSKKNNNQPRFPNKRTVFP